MKENMDIENDILEKDVTEEIEQEEIEQEENASEEKDIRIELEKKEKECEEYIELLKRTKAEYDNFRRRTAKEKEVMYDDAFGDAVKEFLPIIDNFERALSFNTEKNSFSEGIEMILKMFKDTLVKIGVEEIKAEGEKFDPSYHNAVMHIVDESLEENIVVEVLQKGYIYKERVLRFSMVKVAN